MSGTVLKSRERNEVQTGNPIIANMASAGSGVPPLNFSACCLRPSQQVKIKIQPTKNISLIDQADFISDRTCNGSTLNPGPIVVETEIVRR